MHFNVPIMLPQIEITISNNEQNSKSIDDDIEDIQKLKELDDLTCPIDIKQRITTALLKEYRERRIGRPKALELALGYHKEFAKPVFGNTIYDYEFRLGKSVFGVEAKEIADLWQSLITGHFGTQLTNHIDSGNPGLIFVIGSYEDALSGVPKMNFTDGKPKFKKFASSFAVDRDRMRGFIGRAWGSNVPVEFGSLNPVDSFNLMLGIVKHTLNGSTIHQFLPRPNTKIKQQAALCAFTGISETWSTAMIQKFGSLINMGATLEIIPQELADVKSGKQKFGEKRALKVLREMGLSPKRLATLANEWEVELI
jgi:hypothetical protein